MGLRRGGMGRSTRLSSAAGPQAERSAELGHRRAGEAFG